VIVFIELTDEANVSKAAAAAFELGRGSPGPVAGSTPLMMSWAKLDEAKALAKAKTRIFLMRILFLSCERRLGGDHMVLAVTRSNLDN
jgi:hypothetical protein